MVATTQTTYGSLQGSQLMIAGNLCQVDDSHIASVAGAGNSVHFNGDFSFMFAGSTHLQFVKGTTHIVSPALKAALIAAGAPVTVI